MITLYKQSASFSSLVQIVSCVFVCGMRLSYGYISWYRETMLCCWLTSFVCPVPTDTHTNNTTFFLLFNQTNKRNQTAHYSDDDEDDATFHYYYYIASLSLIEYIRHAEVRHVHVPCPVVSLFSLVDAVADGDPPDWRQDSLVHCCCSLGLHAHIRLVFICTLI